MKSEGKNSAIDRRGFLTATGASLLAAAVPASAAPMSPTSFGSTTSAASELRRGKPSASLPKIPIGVFDPVYDNLSLDQMLDTMSSLGMEAVEVGTGGYPNNPHCPLDELIADKAKAKAWQKKFEDKGIRVADAELSRERGASRQRSTRRKMRSRSKRPFSSRRFST